MSRGRCTNSLSPPNEREQYLNALFCGPFKDSKAPIVDIHDVQPDVFSLVINFMYDGACTLTSRALLEPLLAAASILQVQSLVSTAAQEMEKHVDQGKRGAL